MCINEGSGATDYTLIGEFKPLLISSFVLRAILWLRRPNVINRYKNGVDESKESKSLVYITHVVQGSNPGTGPHGPLDQTNCFIICS